VAPARPAHDIGQFSRSRRRCIDEISDTFEICERVHVWSGALERIRDHQGLTKDVAEIVGKALG